MDRSSQSVDFFFTDGTLRSNSPSYVRRPADEELFQLAKAGKFCYILATRQMGKSSLMTRIDIRLQQQGICTVKIDLTQMGTTDVTADQWYLGLLTWIKRKLGLSVDVEAWWLERAFLSVVQRFTAFLRDIVLAEIDSRIVIFIDEINTTLKLEFSDDFFAAIRAIYNARADEPEFSRLTFILLGVATPSDLIKDTARTPFNVGHGVDLREFNRESAQVLQEGLDQFHPGQGKAILDRIFYWTSGHPYLTQKLCQSAATAGYALWTGAQVDNLVHSLFLSEEGRQEANLQFIRTNIIHHPERARLLALYRDVYQGKPVVEDKRSREQNYLRLFGLIQAEKGILKVRNEIYRRSFDLAWVKANMPSDWKWRYTIATTVVILGLIVVLTVFTWRQGQNTNEALIEVFVNSFNTNEPTLRLVNLANLFELDADTEARSLFSALAIDEQLAIFDVATPNLQPQVKTIVQGLYTTLPHNEADTRLLASIRAALARLDDSDPEIADLSDEIDFWLAGRAAVAEADYDKALVAYSTAIGKNDKNPATYFERGQVFAARQGYSDALKDFETALVLRNEHLPDYRAEIYFERGKVYAAVQEYDRALTDLENALNLSQSPAIYLERALVLAAIGQHDAALTDLELVLNLDANWTPQVQQALKANGQLEQALWRETESHSLLTGFVATPVPTSTAVPTGTPLPSSTPTLNVIPTPLSILTHTPTLVPRPTTTPVRETDYIIYVQSNYQYHNLGLSTSAGEPINAALLSKASAPTWCSGEKHVAFFAEPGVGALDTGIWIARYQDKALHEEKLLLGIDHVQNLSCSPLGDKLAFEVILNPNRPLAEWETQVQVIYSNPERSNIIVDKFPGKQPAWQNNNQVVFNTCEGSACGLFSITCIGDACDYPGKTQLTYESSDSYPNAAPDGSALAFSRMSGTNWDIYVLKPGAGPRNLTRNLGGTNTTPVFSPDGRTIYFRTDSRGGSVHWDILGVELDIEGQGQYLILTSPVVMGVGPSDNAGLARPAVFN